jgi:MarR family transcriptional regulator, organic hydroperoxide resistance regulator
VNARRQGGYLTAKIHQTSGRIFARMLRDAGIKINPAQGRIMFALWRRDDVPIQELGRETALEKSTLTSMLDRLEKTGFIRRVPSNEDRRRIHIRRTAKDKALEKKYLAVSAEMTELFYRGFPPEDIDRFEDFLLRIYDNLARLERPEAPKAG